ncbi:acyltransferase [Starkeya sp. 3C]|uniref:Acyltransferase n=1 Tax=Ancylobacter moscoviensis TaxID=2597768 RepID=A0ABY3DUB1_9HYPH|nr:acyltransferase family protein [Ancylobacter moscoviensis]TSJ63909.1 acyltransferase [Ancylobacter moscoviensis]
MRYRPEIDGLRAVAVLPVILFHAGFSRFSGGFVGVDVFFVISGYLITSILAGELEQGSFSLARFYERRARRILPALFFVVAACIPFAWMWMLPSQFEGFALSVGAVALFVSNILFWRETGYFSAVAEDKPLLHTWSLAVEEQFYILFPLLLLLLWRLGRRRAVAGVAVISLVSLGLAEHGWRNHPEANFYLIQSRAWELGAGALCALAMHGRAPRPNAALSLLGLGMIVFAVLAYDATTPFPSLYALVPVGGAALIILFAAPSTPAGRVLASRPLVGLGLISYSAYLWHQPLFAFARIRSLDAPGPGLMLMLSIATLGLAYLSWRFVERPFRSGNVARSIPRRSLFGAAAGASALLVAFGAFGYFADGAPFRLPERAVALLRYETDWNGYDVSGTCSFNELHRLEVQPAPGCADYMVGGKADVVFIGDSHSGAISQEAQEALRRAGISSYAVSYTGCIGLPGFYRADRTKWHACDEYNRAMLDFAQAIGAKAVVLTSRFAAYVDAAGFDNGEGGVETNMAARLDVLEARDGGLPEAGRRDRVMGALKGAVESVADRMSVVLVYPIPEAGWNVPQRAARLAMQGEPGGALSTSYDAFIRRNGAVLAVFDAVDRPNVFRVRPYDLLCDAKQGRCRNAEGDVSFYFDDDHLSSAGARLIVPELVKQIRRAMASPPAGHSVAGE